MKTDAANLASQLVGLLARAQAKSDKARAKLPYGLDDVMEQLGKARDAIELAHERALHAVELLERGEREAKKVEASS